MAWVRTAAVARPPTQEVHFWPLRLPVPGGRLHRCPRIDCGFLQVGSQWRIASLIFVRPKVNVDLPNLSSLINDVFLDAAKYFCQRNLGGRRRKKSWENIRATQCCCRTKSEVFKQKDSAHRTEIKSQMSIFLFCFLTYVITSCTHTLTFCSYRW